MKTGRKNRIQKKLNKAKSHNIDFKQNDIFTERRPLIMVFNPETGKSEPVEQ